VNVDLNLSFYNNPEKFAKPKNLKNGDSFQVEIGGLK
jgi:hypothetical protein